MIALADAEQRIYEFRGADPARIGEFITCFNPKQFDFGIENNRSKGTDILEFGNDLLTDKNRGKIYKNVQISPYPFRQGYGSHFDLKLSVFKTRKKLLESGLKNWSIAVLVPSKKLMLEVSDFLNAIQVLPNNRKFPAIKHEVALESAGPSLAGILIAGLLDSGSKKQIEISALINNLCEHARGRNGSDVPSQAIIELTEALSAYVSSGKIRGTKRQTIINECKSTMIKCNELNFTGNPLEDWITVQNIINENTSEIFKKVFVDSKYLRLLHKSSELRASFGNLWRIHGNYNGAVQAIKTALLQEYFSSSSKLWTGINVMTIHKSKGKEFDEVIIYEGRFHGKIISNIEDEKKLNQSRLNLRVAATRAKDNVTIITPNNDICFFLKG
ncbi:DNA-dependent helicase II [compost metagenome]